MIAVVVSGRLACAQSESAAGDFSLRPSVLERSRTAAAAERQQSVPLRDRSQTQTSPRQRAAAGTPVTSAYYQVPAGDPPAPADASRTSHIGQTPAASTGSFPTQPAVKKRPATRLAPRSAFGLREPEPGEATGSQTGTFGSILIGLGFVIVLMLGVAKVVQRKNPFAVTGVPREAIDVLGRRTIDPRNAIYIVRVGPKILLLGNSANGLTTLSEINDPIEVAALANTCRAASESSSTDAATWFRSWFRRRTPGHGAASFEDRFGERLMTDAQRGESGTVTSVSIAPRQGVRRA